MRSATWKTYLKNIRAILQTIDQCTKAVKEIQTAMLVSVFVFNFPFFRIKKKPRSSSSRRNGSAS
jgi:hypothetical protein